MCPDEVYRPGPPIFETALPRSPRLVAALRMKAFDLRRLIIVAARAWCCSTGLAARRRVAGGGSRCWPRLARRLRSSRAARPRDPKPIGCGRRVVCFISGFGSHRR